MEFGLCNIFLLFIGVSVDPLLFFILVCRVLDKITEELPGERHPLARTVNSMKKVFRDF